MLWLSYAALSGVAAGGEKASAALYAGTIAPAACAGVFWTTWREEPPPAYEKHRRMKRRTIRVHQSPCFTV